MRGFIYLGLILGLMLSAKAENHSDPAKQQDIASQFLHYHDLLTLKLNELNQSLTIPEDVKQQLSAKIKENINQLKTLQDKIAALALLYAEATVEQKKQEKGNSEPDHKNDESVREEIEYLDKAARHEQDHIHKEIDQFLNDLNEVQKKIAAFKAEEFAHTLQEILASTMNKMADFIRALKDKKKE